MSPKSEPTKTYRFEILRSGPSADDPPHFRGYDLVVDRKMSVLEAILKIQDEQDPSLAFRYSCRGAICGSCAMSINGKLNLACRVQLQMLPTTRIVLEPLPGFEIIKDLVVNMDAFWAKYERIQPWLHAEVAAAQERHMTEKERQRIDQYISCILCGLCYAACPVSRSNDSFTGPAMLAKLYRFLADSREQRNGDTLRQENSADGMWGCHTIMKCIEVCPKDVRPTDGIRGVRWESLVRRTKALFGRGQREA